jgi:hypothetical protein
LAILRDLWQEQDDFPDPEEPRWWEVWLTRLTTEHDPSAILKAVAARREWPIVNDLGTILSTSAIPSELHKARVTSEILDLDHYFQRDLITDLETRIDAAPANSAAVCVLDTGLMSAHPLLRASVDTTHSVLDGLSPADQAGHGSQMAGLALFEDLSRSSATVTMP